MCNQHNNRIGEAAELRSHRRLGAELGLYRFSEYAPGMAFWRGPGMGIWNALAELWREENMRMGYEEVRSPLVYDAELWRQSGHWDKYRENMYVFDQDGREQGLKPMNCPGHIVIYQERPRSYRELPVRLSEMGHVHRYEQSGNVNGLLRARSFVIDDAHLFCLENQIAGEVAASLALARRVYDLFGLELEPELSLRPDERLGDDDLWDRAEQALRSALEERGLSYEEQPGGGAFYGPKIDLHMRDSLGRRWQLGSVQLDYLMPERFDLRFVGADGRDQDESGQAHRPVIVHRAMFGSFERFIGILVEHFDGELPLWCAPRPVIVLPRGEEDDRYCRELVAGLGAAGVRAEIDARPESLGKRVREAEKLRVPVILAVGPREREAGRVSVRRRGSRELEQASREDVVERLGKAVRERRRAF